jgi:hypothetical protein
MEIVEKLSCYTDNLLPGSSFYLLQASQIASVAFLLVFSKSGRNKKAIKQAVKIELRLVGDRPAAYTPDLTESLNRFSLRLSDLSRHEEAFQVAEEAAKLCRGPP